MNHKLMKICLSEPDNFAQKIQRIERAGYRYEYEERAAILEYDGGLSRDEADQQALHEIWVRIQRSNDDT